MPKLSKGKARVLQPEEFKRLLRFIAKQPHAKRDTLLILMSYGLGLRAIELAALRVKDVVTSTGEVREDVSLTRTKGNKQRFIYLTEPRIQEALEEYLEERLTIGLTLDQALFISNTGGEYNNKTIQKHLERLYKAAKLAGVSSHSGRRTFATNLVESGIDIKALSTLMGHSSVSTTAHYVQDNPARLRKLVTAALY